MKYRLILTIIFLICINTVSNTKDSTFHLITLGDITSSDIKNGINQDLINVKQYFGLIASDIKYELNHKEFSGSKLNINNVIGYIDTLSTDESNIMVFYYSGHGIMNNYNSVFNLPNGEQLNLKTIKTHINEKSFKNKFFILDCCRKRTKYNITSSGVIFKIVDEKKRAKNYCKLFLEISSIEITAFSCSSGGIAYTHSSTGSYYTNELFDTLSNLAEGDLLETSTSNWCTILKTTSRKTFDKLNGNSHYLTQEPVFEFAGCK
jgi:hypothetical protein